MIYMTAIVSVLQIVPLKCAVDAVNAKLNTSQGPQ